MFVRRKHNKSGTTSIQVVAKADGRYRVEKSFGSSRDEAILASLEEKAKQWANEHEFGEGLFAPEGAAEYDAMMAGIGQDQLRLVGPDLIYGRLFDKIGFNTVRTSDNDIFKSLVVTRLYRPGSKLKTLRYMAYFMNKYYNEDKIYRYLDELCWRPEAKGKSKAHDVKHDVEQVTYEQTKRVLGGTVAVVFYDTTTMYCESHEDTLADAIAQVEDILKITQRRPDDFNAMDINAILAAMSQSSYYNDSYLVKCCENANIKFVSDDKDIITINSPITVIQA